MDICHFACQQHNMRPFTTRNQLSWKYLLGTHIWSKRNSRGQRRQKTSVLQQGPQLRAGKTSNNSTQEHHHEQTWTNLPTSYSNKNMSDMLAAAYVNSLIIYSPPMARKPMT